MPAFVQPARAGARCTCSGRASPAAEQEAAGDELDAGVREQHDGAKRRGSVFPTHPQRVRLCDTELREKKDLQLSEVSKRRPRSNKLSVLQLSEVVCAVLGAARVFFWRHKQDGELQAGPRELAET